MPPEPSVTSAHREPFSCTFRYSSALLPKSFERPGPKSVSPAMNCSGVEVVVCLKWIVDICAPLHQIFTLSLIEVLRLAYAAPLLHLENDSPLDWRFPGFALILLHSHDAATLGVGRIFNLVHEGAHPKDPPSRRLEQVLRL